MPRPGRPKGSPNKRSLAAERVIREFEDELRASGRLKDGQSLDPLKVMALEMIEGDDKLAAAIQLAKYLYPQRKAVELSDTTEAPPPMATRDAIAMIEAAINRVERSRAPAVER